MKIVSLILTSKNGGAEQVFIDYMRVLRDDLGHEVLAIIKQNAPYAEELERLNIPYKKIKNNFGYHDIFAINQIKKTLQDFNADALISHAGKSIILGRKAIKKIKNKKIFEVAINHSYNVKRSIGADVIISVNRQIFFKTIDQGQGEDKSFVILNATDLNNVKKNSFQDLQKKQVVNIGIIGRFDKSKGFDTAIQMMKILKDSCDKKIILKIAGIGKEEKNLKSLVKKLHLEKEVEFIGWIKDKEEFFNSIDIFLLTSKSETFGLVIIEAMKFCKPIIASDADGPKEIIKDKVNGLLVELEPSNDVAQRFAKAVKTIITDPESTNKMIENSSLILHEKFSFSTLAKKLKEIFGTNK